MKCQYCHKQMTAMRKTKRFCSPRCQHKQWLYDHPGKKSEYDRQDYQKHYQKRRKYIKNWYENNKDRALTTRRKNEDKKLNNNQRNIVYQRDNNRCTNCNISQKDHLKKHGKRLCIVHMDGTNAKKIKHADNSIQNLQTLCLKCQFLAFNSKHKIT